MGTSTARKPPSGRLWRAAKTAAGRYLATAGDVVSAQEVLHRYVAAVTAAAEAEGASPFFRLARQVAQELGAFWEERIGQPAAEAPSPLAGLARAQALAETWLPEKGSLESAVCRSALITVLHTHLTRSTRAATEVVRDFLAQAVAVRLYLDLGETLESMAPDSARLQQGWEGLRRVLWQRLTASEPPPTGAWRKLAGWLWITRLLEGLKAR